GASRSIRLACLQFDLTQDFPVGLDQLWTALGRADYVEQKYRALGSTSLRMLKFSADAESIEVEFDRQAPVDRKELPVWARVLTGKRQAMHQHTRWRRAGPGRVEAEFDISAPGVPVSARGTGTVVELFPGHARLTMHFDVRSTLAALKFSVARIFAQQLKQALQADHAFTLAYLRGGALQ
ncbi:MAG: DUF2505 domain-containing protein, partial [Gemmatimonadota bacterium]